MIQKEITDCSRAMNLPEHANTLLEALSFKQAESGPQNLTSFSVTDWENLATAAIKYRLAFVLSRYLRNNPASRGMVPPQVFERLTKNLRRTLMFNLGQQRQIVGLLQACEKRGIPVLLVKGMWLVEQVYRDLTARSSGDIDLLLRPEHMPEFTTLLRELGFDIPGEVKDLRDIARENNEFPVIHPVSRTCIDVHWGLTHPTEEASVDHDKLRNRAEWTTIGGAPCQTLRLEDHLLFLCFHAAIHHYFIYVGPRALLDIAMVLSQPPRSMNWPDFIERATELGWSRGVWLMLDLVREHVGVQPDQSVMDALRPEDASDPEVREAALEAMFLDQQLHAAMDNNLVRYLGTTGLFERMKILVERVFPSADYLATQYQVAPHGPGIYLLYVKRWLDLIRIHLPKMIAASQPSERQAELQRALAIRRWLNT